ncbi:hypothetical protein ACUNWD_05405 [Sunxiuqinia sp. A32]|uniref:hypothetical protein n=1 Tax=Sunxiuqinia sp. A32 TaxID=3461496 RepID=UPI0040464962
MMNPVSPTIYKKINEVLLSSFQVEDELFSVFGKRKLKSLNSGSDLYNLPKDYIQFTKELNSFFKKNLKDAGIDTFANSCQDFKSILDLLGDFPNATVIEQSRERFYSQEEDSSKIKFFKFWKRFFLKIGWATSRIGNIFRKEKRKLKFWKQIVPEKSLAEYVFLNRFIEELFPVYQQLLKNKEDRIRLFYEIDWHLERKIFNSDESVSSHALLDELKDNIQQDKNELDLFFNSIYTKLNEEFKSLGAKTGTVEFSVKNLNRKRLVRSLKKLLYGFDKIRVDLQINQFALADYWRLKLNNRNLIFELLSKFHTQGNEVDKQLNQVLKPVFIEFKKSLTKIVDQLSSVKNTSTTDILSMKIQVEDKVSESLQLIYRSRIAYQLEKTLTDFEKDILSSPSVFVFAPNVFHGKQVLKKQLKLVRSGEILQGAILGIVKKGYAEYQKKIGLKVQKLNDNLTEIQHLVEYSVEYYQEQSDKESGLKELIDGISRSVRKAEENLGYLSDLEELALQAANSTCSGFIETSLQFFEPDRLFKTEKENRRRAYFARKKEFISSRLLQVIQLLKLSTRWLKRFYAESNDRYFNLRNLLGISTEKEPISSELSNYLSETKEAIKRLPVLYQKLFEASSLTDERFYIPRKPEMSKLVKSYESWKKGNFAPTCLVGEQGSGATTLFNFFTNEVQDETEVDHFIISKKITTEVEFVNYFKQVFPGVSFESLEELIFKVNGLQNPRIIILENIHNLYIRRNGAMGNPLLLFKLMSSTNKNVFWLCSCFVYGWKLLDYTLSISGYFAHVVDFEMMSQEMVRKAIMLRHRVSGFDLKFIESEHFSPKRGYQKLSEEEKQTYLSDLFFQELWEHAQSNMTMAFIYWLRAIIKVESDTLYLQQKQLSYSFLNSLKESELTTLHAVLIHGGLTIEELAAVLRIDYQESARRLMVLDDDGLLDYSGEKQVINPLLYRTLVGQLKSLNFIY